MAKRGGATSPQEIRRVEKAVKRVKDAENLSPDQISPDSIEGVRISNSELAETTHVNNGYQEPWLRLPDESDRGWEMFKFYRDLGPIRTTNMVTDHFDIAQPTVYHYSSKYDWNSRVAAFDQFEDRIYQAQRVVKIREMADTHADLIVSAIQGLNKPLEILMEKINDPQFVHDLKDEEAVTLLAMARQSAKLLPNLMSAERLARGMATEIVEHQGEINHNVEVDREAVVEVYETLRAAGAFDARTLAELDAGGTGSDSEIIEGEIVEVRPDDSDPEAESVPPT